MREIDELLSWLEHATGIHPVIVAGILHYQFVSIHPLADGNGRTARLLTHLHLGLKNYDFRSSLVLESYYSVDKQAYYTALSLADNYDGRKNASLNTWLDYFVDGFLSSAKVLAIEVNALSEAEDILAGISKRTIQRRLMKLVDNGYLTTKGGARNTRYVWKNR